MKEKSTKPDTGPLGDGEENNDAYIKSHPTMGRRNAVGTHDSLCWHCRNALGGCSWSMRFEPVEGWDAKHTKRYNSYKVYSCPQFVRG